MAKFGTIEVYEELSNILNSDPKWADAGRSVTNTFAFRYREPLNRSFFVRFDSGKVTETKELDESSAEEPDFILDGTPDTWREVLEGKLSPMAAVTSGKLKVKGNMMKLMTLMKPFGHVMETLTTIELA